MTADVYIARQPIFDIDRQVFGYELLYRAGPDEVATFDDPDEATQAVIERAYLHWGMERLIGDRFGMINASPSLLRSDLHHALPPEGIILEIREDEPFDERTVEALLRARRNGYHLGLDNVSSLIQLQRSTALPHTNMVKVDLVHADPADLSAMVEFVRRRVPGAMLTAEKIQTADEHKRCISAGFDLFQGHYFAMPEVLRRAARPTHVPTVLALLEQLERSEVDIDRIEMLVGSDPTLAYRLLAVVNSSAFGLNRRVESLRHAIVLLGTNQVRRMAAMLARSAASNTHEDVMMRGATRARVLASLAHDPQRASMARTVGLLSVTNELYDTPMDQLLGELYLADEIEIALLAHEGELGRLLSAAEAYEHGDFDRIDEFVPGGADEVRAAYDVANHWADLLRGTSPSTTARDTDGRLESGAPTP